MPDPRPKRRSPALLALLAVLVALIVVAVIRASTREVVAVRVSPVTHENLVSTVSTNGKVEPIREFQAHAPAAGVVDEIYVQVGQKVKTGDLLLRLDAADAAARLAASKTVLRTVESAAQAVQRGGSQDERILSAGDLTRAQQTQEQTAASLATLKQLQAKGAASVSEVTSAQDRLDAANAALKTAQIRSGPGRFDSYDRSRAQTQLADARAGLSAAQSAYDKAVVRAPFPGTVYSIAVNPYDFVPGGEDLLDLADLNKIRITAYFDEPEIGKLSIGQPVKIVWEAKPERAWHGHVEVAPTTIIAYNTRNVGEAMITVDNAQGDLLPNTNVTVTVTTKQRFNVLSVPREALHTEGTTSFVYRVINRHLQRTVVQVGAQNLTRVEITGGLSEKDIVALNATSNRDLANGLEVKSVE
jgi:HlyD family secretion protein